MSGHGSRTSVSLRPPQLATGKQFTYSGEGWGMTRTTKELITSDGTATLRFRDPNTFQETRHIVVKERSIIVDRLNELEFIKGESTQISALEYDRAHFTADGRVVAWIDLTGLLLPIK